MQRLWIAVSLSSRRAEHVTKDISKAENKTCVGKSRRMNNTSLSSNNTKNNESIDFMTMNNAIKLPFFDFENSHLSIYASCF